jgi:hypothetical protein
LAIRTIALNETPSFESVQHFGCKCGAKYKPYTASPLGIVLLHPKSILEDIVDDLLSSLTGRFLVWHIIQWVTLGLKWLERSLNFRQLKLRTAAIFVNILVERFRESSLQSINDKISTISGWYTGMNWIFYLLSGSAEREHYIGRMGAVDC